MSFHLLKWKIILCSSSSNHCRWSEGVQHTEGGDQEQEGTSSSQAASQRYQQYLSSFAAKAALLGWFCVQTHFYLSSSRNSCTDFRELRSTPAFLSQWKFFYHPKSLVAHKAFCSDQKAILNVSEKPEAKRVWEISHTNWAEEPTAEHRWCHSPNCSTLFLFEDK